jgi:hypothetical protein
LRQYTNTMNHCLGKHQHTYNYRLIYLSTYFRNIWESKNSPAEEIRILNITNIP